MMKNKYKKLKHTQKHTKTNIFFFFQQIEKKGMKITTEISFFLRPFFMEKLHYR